MLTYSSSEVLVSGTLVKVPMKTTTKEAVVIKQTTKPEFETQNIDSVTPYFFSPLQLEVATFVSYYYVSTLGEALGLFVPFATNEPIEVSDIAPPSPHLTKEQQIAYDALLNQERALLFGVTGAGKTEVFIALIANVIAEGKNGILLMPEISLTPQMEVRLKHYFGDSVVLWHSKLSKKKRQEALQSIRNGTARLVAGARSALFVPLANVGIVVVDEEHDDSYKAMTKPRYHARDVALFMGEKSKAKVLLASATPSATSFYKYPIVCLDTPFVKTSKTYHFTTGEGLNHQIEGAISKHLLQGGKMLLFLPTRGNFKYLYCPSCGATHRCPFCSVGMALHRNHRHLRCHYCGYSEAIAQSCTSCGYAPLSTQRIGTAEVKEMLTQSLPKLVIEQFDKDTITTHNKLTQALKRFEKGESQMLLGTQMLSKGHDYGDITLAIVMGLDYVLGLCDYRAKERAMALLFQVGGRSGRAKEAEVWVQTSNEALFREYIDNYKKFLDDELAFRQALLYPPFGFLARIIITHKNIAKAQEILEQIADKLSSYKTLNILGLGAAPIEKIANNYRLHIMLHTEDRKSLINALHEVYLPNVVIDMDPVDFS